MTVSSGVNLSMNFPVSYKAGNIFYSGTVCLLLELDIASLSYADCWNCVFYIPELYCMLFYRKDRKVSHLIVFQTVPQSPD